MKLRVVPGRSSPARLRRGPSSNGGGRGRAEQDPIVRRMKEKFGAEIRTIIDYKEKALSITRAARARRPDAIHGDRTQWADSTCRN